MKTKVLLIALFVLNLFQVSAQSVDEVTLVVSSDGATKEEATLKALRSAIEQTYGAFVSANTEILNDELVKDEIVTVSTGNIKKYEEIAHSTLPNGNQYVTLNATVCVSKLVSYAQSKGASTEFAGATFAMNLKMDELYAKNELTVLKNLYLQLSNIPDLFDIKLEMEEPEVDYYNRSRINVSGCVRFKINQNTKLFNKIVLDTFLPFIMNGEDKDDSDLPYWKRKPKLYLPFKWELFDRRGKRINKYPQWRCGMGIAKVLDKVIDDYIDNNTRIGLKANTGEIFKLGEKEETNVNGIQFESGSLFKLNYELVYGVDYLIREKYKGIEIVVPGYCDNGSIGTQIAGIGFKMVIPRDKIGNYSKFEVVNLKEE